MQPIEEPDGSHDKEESTSISLKPPHRNEEVNYFCYNII